MKNMFLKSLIFILCCACSPLATAATSSAAAHDALMEVMSLPSENRQAVMQAKGSELYPELVKIAFSDTQPMSMRWKALIAMGEARGEEATVDLLKAGKHAQWFMRNAALVSLETANPKEAEKLALTLIKDKALVVRSAAVETLRKNVSSETRDLLWEELNQQYNFKNNQSLWIRPQIVEVLAQNPQNHEFRIFKELLTDRDSRVQLPAVHGLEKLTGTRLGEEKTKSTALVNLWKDYLKKEKVEL